MISTCIADTGAYFLPKITARGSAKGLNLVLFSEVTAGDM